MSKHSDTEEPPSELEASHDLSDALLITDEPSDTGQILDKEEEDDGEKEPLASKDSPPKETAVPQPNKPQSIGPRQPFRQKFQRWPNLQPPRWNHLNQQHQQQMPFSRGPNQILRPPGGHMRPGPQRHPFPPNHPQFFNNNNFMQGRPPMRQPMVRQRFFYPNQPHGDPSMQGSPAYVPSPIMSNPVPVIPRIVHINPNFKGGVEAAKSK